MSIGWGGIKTTKTIHFWQRFDEKHLFAISICSLQIHKIDELEPVPENAKFCGCCLRTKKLRGLK